MTKTCETFHLQSFAKINLGLEITGKRPDGYHTLKTIFQTVDLFDTIDITPNNTGKINLSGSDASVEWDERNTMFKAFAALYDRCRLSGGFDVFVHKTIPAGSGLGGGSSNAAVILLFLNDYFKLDLSLETLVEIGARIGADVPFFLLGGTVLAEGIGDIMTPLQDDFLPETPIGIVIPPVKVSTKKIFSNFHLTSKQNRSKIEFFMRSKNHSVLENHLEQVTFELFPEIGKTKEKMTALDYGFVMMSGSGASVYCTASDVHLSDLKPQFADSLVFVTNTLNRNSYFNRLGASPSGKASVFGADTRRFESFRPCISPLP